MYRTGKVSHSFTLMTCEVASEWKPVDTGRPSGAPFEKIWHVTNISIVRTPGAYRLRIRLRIASCISFPSSAVLESRRRSRDMEMKDETHGDGKMRYERNKMEIRQTIAPVQNRDSHTETKLICSKT